MEVAHGLGMRLCK